MDKNKVDEDYKINILQQLHKRNSECNKFKDIITSHASLYENVSAIKAENQNLSEQITILKQQNLDLQVKVEAGALSNNGAVKSEKYAALEQKVYRLQEELTELHRKKGANAQQVMNLNLALQENEKERTKLDELANERALKLESFQKENLAARKDLEDTVEKFKLANQIVNDEHQALLLAYEAIEKKLIQAQDDNAALVERSVRWQEEEAERNIVVKKEANEAASEFYKQALEKSSPPPKQLISTIRSMFSSSKKPSSSNLSFVDPPVTNTLARSSSLIVQLPFKSRIKWQAHSGEVSTVRYSPSGEILATGGSDRLVKIWNISGDKCSEMATLRGCNGGINNIDYDPTERVLVTCSSDYATRLWTLHTQRERLTLTGHSGKVLSVRYLAYSDKVVTGSQDRTVKLWDVKSGSCVKTYMPGSSCNDLVAADMSGECIASGHFDRKIRFYDTRSTHSQTMYEIEVSGRITSLDMPAEKNTLLCCVKDHKLNLIDMRTRSVLQTFSHDNFKVATDYSRCTCSPDGEYVSVGSSDGSVFTWSVLTGALESCTQVHNDPVISCSWNGQLVTGDKHGFCVIWADT